MTGTAFSLLLMFGFHNLVIERQNAHDAHLQAGQEASLSATSHPHVPSAGLTLETLEALPPRHNSWPNPGRVATVGLTSATYGIPSYSALHPSYPMATYRYGWGGPTYGLGGFVPPGAGGWSRVGWLFW